MKRIPLTTVLTAGVYFGWLRTDTDPSRVVWSTVDNNCAMWEDWGMPNYASAGPPHITMPEIGITELRRGKTVRLAPDAERIA